MTILGAQLVLTVIMASLMQRLNQHISFGQWFLCRKLYRYLYPSNEDLKQAAGLTSNNKPQKGRKRKDTVMNGTNHQKSESFTIPKTTPITLDCAQVTPLDCLPLRFYPDFQWLVDVSVCSLTVYTLTEIYMTWVPSALRELNLSLVWCAFIIVFTLKLMLSLTTLYFRSEDHGEGILCSVFGFFFLVLSMGFLITTEDTLDLGLDSAYTNFSKSAMDFLNEQEIESQGPVSLTTFRIILAVISAVIGLFMTFPGLRLAKMHMDALRHAQGQPITILALHLNFIAPILLVLLWVKPAIFNHVTRPTGFRPALMSADTFYTFRLWCVVLFCLYRFCMTTPHLQAHLNMAVDRVTSLKREAGRISNTDYQKLVVHVYYYLCVVALQYVAPLILLLFTCFCMKTLGGLTWTGFLELPYPEYNSTATTRPAGNSTVAYVAMSLSRLRCVFTQTWYHGLLSYFTWWMLVCWPVTSVFGLIYHTYFIDK